MEPITIGIIGLAAWAAYRALKKSAAAPETGPKEGVDTGRGTQTGDRVGAPFVPPPPTMPVQTSTAYVLAPLAAADLEYYLGLYDQALLMRFKDAAGLRNRLGQQDPVYAGRAQGALLHYGVKTPPIPLPGKLPDRIVPYKLPEEALVKVQKGGPGFLRVGAGASGYDMSGYGSGGYGVGGLVPEGPVYGAGVGAEPASASITAILGTVLGLVNLALNIGKISSSIDWENKADHAREGYRQWQMTLHKLDKLGEAYPRLRVRGSDRVFRFVGIESTEDWFDRDYSERTWNSPSDYMRFPWVMISQEDAIAREAENLHNLGLGALGDTLFSPDWGFPDAGDDPDNYVTHPAFLDRALAWYGPENLMWHGWTTSPDDKMGMEETNRLTSVDWVRQILAVDPGFGQDVIRASIRDGINDPWKDQKRWPVHPSEWDATLRAMNGMTFPMRMPENEDEDWVSIRGIGVPSKRYPFAALLYPRVSDPRIGQERDPAILLEVVAENLRSNARVLTGEPQVIASASLTPTAAPPVDTARTLAQNVADNVRTHGEGYSTDVVEALQTAQGFEEYLGMVWQGRVVVGHRPDGRPVPGYGPKTRDALARLGIADPPAPLPSALLLVNDPKIVEIDTAGRHVVANVSQHGEGYDDGALRRFQTLVGVQEVAPQGNTRFPAGYPLYGHQTVRALGAVGILNAPAPLASAAQAMAFASPAQGGSLLWAAAQDPFARGGLDQRLGLDRGAGAVAPTAEDLQPVVSEASKAGVDRDSPIAQQAIGEARKIIANDPAAVAKLKVTQKYAKQGNQNARALMQLIGLAIRGPEGTKEGG